MTAPAQLTAVVLAGGASRRLGGVDKLALLVGGRPLLARVLDVLAEVGWPAVVAGPRRPLPADVPEPSWVVEPEPGGGPAAATARRAEGGGLAVRRGARR